MPTLLTTRPQGRKNYPVAANSVTGNSSPNHKAQNTRPSSDAGAFFMPASVGAYARQSMAGGAGGRKTCRSLCRSATRVARHPLRNARAAVIQHVETAP